MAKILLLVLGLLAVYWMLKGYRNKITGRRGSSHAIGEDMVRCAQCGVHLPRSDSIMSDQVFYCSAEHRRLHQKSG